MRRTNVASLPMTRRKLSATGSRKRSWRCLQRYPGSQTSWRISTRATERSGRSMRPCHRGGCLCSRLWVEPPPQSHFCLTSYSSVTPSSPLPARRIVTARSLGLANRRQMRRERSAEISAVYSLRLSRGRPSNRPEGPQGVGGPSMLGGSSAAQFSRVGGGFVFKNAVQIAAGGINLSRAPLTNWN
jgi:hypothetical protein